MSLTIEASFLSLGKKARGLNGKPVFFQIPVTHILIHWIGPYPRQSAFTPIYWWEDGPDGRGVQASAHFCVKDFTIVQALPLDEVGWHSGDARNRFSIGIEVVPMNTAGEFSPATIDTLRALVVHIRKTHPGAKTIERHFDGPRRKDCPRFYTPVTNLAGSGMRVANPPGGDARWQNLRARIDGGA